MTAAIANICVDPRLDHNAIRAQMRDRLQRMGIQADWIFVTADVGGNVGSALRNTLRLIEAQRQLVALVAILHHDDCIAARAGMRKTLEAGIAEIREAVVAGGMQPTKVLTGDILTETNLVRWSDEPPRRFEVLSFRMPRMMG